SVVKAGQIVKVKVLEVDEKRKRIALTMRLSDAPEKTGEKPQAAPRPPRDPRGQGKPAGGKPNRAPASAPMGGAMAAAFSKLKS
ncbi:MAG: S1 RNA-binding domain-containing protein, partial [Thiobacillus sp.]|nr:S1 RNA-binding domain-containing protein [Thiobacillus sp.]